jgi:hypothetical protein
MDGGMVAFQSPEVAVAIEFLRRMRAAGTHAYDRSIPDTATNRRKLSEGKPPSTYAWRTAVVAPTPPRKPSAGGTHASPRLHERRGHWRHLHSGDAVWVRPCLVGSPERGVVEKDYRVPNACVKPPSGSEVGLNDGAAPAAGVAVEDLFEARHGRTLTGQRLRMRDAGASE